ncbi:hypothetical protein U9M48_021036 [Paspalum notatum var. saurae]|uniref:Uncharacterized protein n=1 Tax=Paspalum notatum var. saurae TaxID=547442 RepID=A0AAQ3TGH5_PASNO
MEPVFAVVHEDPPVQAPPAPQKHGLGSTPPPPPPQVQGGGGWRVAARRVLGLVVFLATTAAFVVSIYRSRHSARDLALAIATQFLGTVLGLCFVKLKQLRGDRAAEVAVERRRVKIGMWVLLVALGCTVAVQLTLAVHGLALKLVVWGVTVFLLGLKTYLLFFRKEAEDAGRPAAELSPEEKV